MRSAGAASFTLVTVTVCNTVFRLVRVITHLRRTVAASLMLAND
jgi:hypothetical protein